ncbi:hypothetical protein B5S28_g4961 [[Candida] boidinii]|nr:hypothetical protein B5S28_g4961 [[Candida] boidinii]OWB64038.1 hypothetical protein B5S29_g5069 [[Candida] boidinii]
MSIDNFNHGISSNSNTNSNVNSNTNSNTNSNANSLDNLINDDSEISIADFNPLAKLEKSTIKSNNTNNFFNNTSSTFISNENINNDNSYNISDIRKNRESKISIISTDSISSTGRLLDKLGLDDDDDGEDEQEYLNDSCNNNRNSIDYSNNQNTSFDSQKSEPANKFKSLRNILLFNKTNENKDSAIESAIAMGSKIHTVNSSKSIKTGFYQNERKSIHAELTSNESNDEINNIINNQDYDINNNNNNNIYYNNEFKNFIPSHQKNNESISTLLDSSFNNDNNEEPLQNSSFNESFEIQDDEESLQDHINLPRNNANNANNANTANNNVDQRSRSDSRTDSITDSISDSISDSRSFEYGDEAKDDNTDINTNNNLYKIVTPVNYNNNFQDLNNNSSNFDSHENNTTRDLKINIDNSDKDKDRQFSNHSYSLSNPVDIISLTRKPHTKGPRSPLTKSFHQGFYHVTAPQNYVANVVDEIPNSPVSKKSIFSTSSSSSNTESAFSSSAQQIASSPSSSASNLENSNSNNNTHNNQRQNYKDQQLQQQLQQRYRKLHSHQPSNSSVPEQIHRQYHQMALFRQMSPSSARSVNTNHSHSSSQSSTSSSSIDRIDSRFDSLNSKTDSLTNSINTNNSINSNDNGNNTINNIPPPKLNQISRTSSNSSLNKHIRQSHSFSNSEFSPFDNPEPPFNNEKVFNTPPNTSSLSYQQPTNINYPNHSHHKSMPVPLNQYNNQEQARHQHQSSQQQLQYQQKESLQTYQYPSPTGKIIPQSIPYVPRYPHARTHSSSTVSTTPSSMSSSVGNNQPSAVSSTNTTISPQNVRIFNHSANDMNPQSKHYRSDSTEGTRLVNQLRPSSGAVSPSPAFAFNMGHPIVPRNGSPIIAQNLPPPQSNLSLSHNSVDLNINSKYDRIPPAGSLSDHHHQHRQQNSINDFDGFQYPSPEYSNPPSIPLTPPSSKSTFTASEIKPIDTLSEKINTDNIPNILTPEQQVAMAISLRKSGKSKEATYALYLASKQGSKEAMLLYGLSLRYGYGVPKDPRKSFKYLCKAGDIDPSKSYSFNINPKELDAAKLISTSNDTVSSALFEIGQSFMNGWGVKINELQGLEFIEKSASLGYVDAMCESGSLWTKPLKVSNQNQNLSNANENQLVRQKDLWRAATWFRLAEKCGANIIENSWIYKQKYMQ